MAGCSGLPVGGAGTSDTTTPTPTATPSPTSTPTPTATATPTSTATESDGSATTGTMAVVVDGERLALDDAFGDSAPVTMASADTWRTDGTPTLARTLAAAGVNASETSLTYDGTTYDERSEGTRVVYRVDGDPVNPAEYELKDGDEVWALVFTEDTNASTPGEYIPQERLYATGTMDVTVNGQSLDFSREKWQSGDRNRHFHFEDGHANQWHAHSWSVTLAYALSTLDGIDVTENGFTYAGRTFTEEEADISVTVNGDPVDPTAYYLTDGDAVRIVVDIER